MGFQPGNQLSKTADHRRPKLFTQAILTALKRTDENNVEAIQRLADRLVHHALTAEPFDVHAVKEIADRVEGKSVQRLAGDDGEPPARMELVWLTGLNQFHDLSTAPWTSSEPPASEANAEPPLSAKGGPEKP